jgi:hypothetical protein
MAKPGIGSKQGIRAVNAGFTIGKITIFNSDGTPESSVYSNSIGDICVDYTNGALYVFTGTAGAYTGWKLVTQAT